MSNTVELEMGYTPEEFARTLNGQFRTRTSFIINTLDSNHWQIGFDRSQVDIRIAKKAPRVIAMLTLPVLQVSFDFGRTDPPQKERFLKQFFQYFHKGGG